MSKIILFIAILLCFFGLYKLTQGDSIKTYPDQESDIIIYWGQGCPHCEVVKKYIKENNIDQKIKLSLKEVYYDKNNQQSLKEASKKCPNVDSNQIGVPIAFAKDECLLGDKPIISWFDQKLLPESLSPPISPSASISATPTTQ